MDPEVARYIAEGQKIHAIKRYREVYGVGLKEAKEAVEAYEEGREIPTPSLFPTQVSDAAGDAGLAAIDALVRAGRKIEAIRLYRERYGLGLKESKDAIDNWQGAGQSQTAPPSAPAPPSPPSTSFLFEPMAPASTVFAAPPPSAVPPTASPSSLPPSVTYVPADRSSAEACTGHIQDRNIGQAIDLALQMGRREEAIQLYMERLRVPRHEAERQLHARQASGSGSGEQQKTGCFIATAAFGGDLAPEVAVLRRYRDRVLRRTSAGRRLVRWYYRFSPPIAAVIAGSPGGRAAVRACLRPLRAWARWKLSQRGSAGR